jgi:hypothetical protein
MHGCFGAAARSHVFTKMVNQSKRRGVRYTSVRILDTPLLESSRLSASGPSNVIAEGSRESRSDNRRELKGMHVTAR